MSKVEPLRLGIAGLGNVGASVVALLQKHAGLLAARAGRRIEIVAVSAHDPAKDRGVDLSSLRWVKNALELAEMPDIDVVVELIGGADGLALALVTEALRSGKHVVTANKALLAHHGLSLAKLAESHGGGLSYEAAVAGGIPVIRALREGFVGNEIKAVYGILNGTCNYILTAMRETGRDFEVILKEAQAQGFAEADPHFDVDGIDAAHKLSILSALAFGVQPDFAHMHIKGIRQVNATDITFAAELGYRIKLLGIARRLKEGFIQTLEPCLVPVSSPIGAIEDVYNAVDIEGDFVQRQFLTGKGAGGGPTASAVVSDIVDVARGMCLPAFGIPADQLASAHWIDPADSISRFYVRLVVLDRPGVLADISAILRDMNVSIEGLIQRGRAPDQPVPIMLTTHETRQGDVQKACAMFKALPSVVDEPCLMRIEDLR